MRSFEYHRTPDEPFRSRWIRSHRLVRSPVAISTGFGYKLHHSPRARVRPRVHGIVGEQEGQPAAFLEEEVRELLFDLHPDRTAGPSYRCGALVKLVPSYNCSWG